eukprot:135994-Rhodomonas_salina.2
MQTMDALPGAEERCAAMAVCRLREAPRTLQRRLSSASCRSSPTPSAESPQSPCGFRAWLCGFRAR